MTECPHCLRKVPENKYIDHERDCDPSRIPVVHSIEEGEKGFKEEVINTGISCKNHKCKGEIISNTQKINNYPSFLQIKGPGGERQSHFETFYYCNTCCISYQFLPCEED
jgi:hypothetical protein